MAKYKQKNVVVDARQFNNTNGKALAGWVVKAGHMASHMTKITHGDIILPEELYVYTDHGEVTVTKGSWIVEYQNVFKIYTNEEFKRRFETA